MPTYPRLGQLTAGITLTNSVAEFQQRVIPYLVDVWLNDYSLVTRQSNIVETSVDRFSYLFDLTAERLIAAWGISRGRHGAKRDSYRMAGHPMSAGPLYHRGHTISHRLGGQADINLVPQRGSVNIGRFKKLENRAVDNPGSLYFTYWVYPSAEGQIPRRVDQGLLIPAQPPKISTHPN